MSGTEPCSDAELEAGRLLFTQAWTFQRGAPTLEFLPPDDRLEIALAGRSNVGKSTLINALVGQRQLARASNTPGRTQELNFFTEPQGLLYLVDMPGYGFAEAPKGKVAAWNRVLRGYLAGRRTLKRVYVLIDARHGLKAADEEILELLDQAAVSYQGVLTKADKISRGVLENVIAQTTAGLARRPAAFPGLIVTSSENGEGIDDLRAAIAKTIAEG